MAKLGFSARTCLGVDIGASRIKVVELGRGATVPNVRAAGLTPTPAGAVVDGKVVDPHAVGRALRGVLQGLGVRTRQAVASVSGQVAIVREVRMPKVAPQEIKTSARFELERFLPYPVAEVTYDTYVIGESSEEGSPRLNVLVVAARTDVLTQHVAAVEGARLDLAAIDMEPFALLWAMASPGNGQGAEAAVYVDIGMSTSEIVIADGGTPRLTRNVVFGGANVTRLIAEHLRVDVEQAEAVKHQLGAASSEGTPDLDQVRQTVLSSFGDLATEIRRSVDYYQTRYRGAPPARVVVTGGTTLLPGVAQYLSADLGIPVDVGDPFAGLAVPDGIPGRDLLRSAAPALAVAAGLARRGVDEL